ncbi:LOW QUALITY PROTEIN: uncharacterized protein LOC6049790 [Culex quinquefasciatus]|uniref:LOW QUALITY PROTEIN: uncharacterized protein LOC6049790 n=1 Tax=Culex quinquefasciatus TaxID=7176 RepID=UPI0018E3A399|nr:LOW QUALITY PROTEIN: uncharacterized protein LOC6049790 [Culex quinquefasciatus]
MVEVSERQTAAVLKVKIMEILNQYGLTLENIFSVTVDNGANMLAAVRQLKRELGLTENTEHLDSDEAGHFLEHERNLTESLSEEFEENINLVRCSIHTLQLAVLDVIKNSDPTVKEITAIAKKCRALKYKPTFDQKAAKYPPVWCQTRWSGIYKMINSFAGQEAFFRDLGEQFQNLTEHWGFIMEYERAFRPCYVCTNKLQGDGVGLSDFYMEWLLAIASLKKMSGNRFSEKLAATLKSRLELLKENRAFKMALYLDPRFNFVGSTIFKPDEKEEIQTYLVDTWRRICKLQPSTDGKETGQAAQKPDDSMLEDDDVNDSYITEMLGGSLDPRAASNEDGQLMKHIKGLDAEPRQNCRYDVWQHWVQREQSHPELYAVAMVVLSTPASQASVERAFSALALVLTDRRGDLGSTALEDTLLIKLNKEIFERIFPTLYDWTEKGTDGISVDGN